MNNDKPQIFKQRKTVRRKEWGRLDLDERDVKSRECERASSRSHRAGGGHHDQIPRSIREL